MSAMFATGMVGQSQEVLVPHCGPLQSEAGGSLSEGAAEVSRPCTEEAERATPRHVTEFTAA